VVVIRFKNKQISFKIREEKTCKHAGEVGDDKARHMTLEENYTEKDTGERAGAYSKKKRSTTRADRLTKEKTRY